MAIRVGLAVAAVLGIYGVYLAADASFYPGRAHRMGGAEGTQERGYSRSTGTPDSRLFGHGTHSVPTFTSTMSGNAAAVLAARSLPAAAHATASAVPATPDNFTLGDPQILSVDALETKSVAVGDINGDGRADIAVTVVSGDNTGGRAVYVYEQTLEGRIGSPQVLTASGGSYNPGLVLGDIDGDKVDDVVMGHQWGVTTFSSKDGFAPQLTNGTVDAQYLVMFDMDHDGHNDLFAQSWHYGGDLFRGDGLGRMQYLRAMDTPGQGYITLRTGELTGDGITDLLFATGQGGRGFWVYPGQQTGGLGAPVFHELVNFPIVSPGSATIGDFNGDGRADVALAHNWNAPEARIIVKFQGADGTLGQEVVIPTSDTPGALATADIDGNGLDDIVIEHSTWAVGYMLQSEKGLGSETLIKLPSTPYTAHPRSDGIAVGDVNSDRCPDVVIANGRSGLAILRGQNCLPKAPPMSRPLPALPLQ